MREETIRNIVLCVSAVISGIYVVHQLDFARDAREILKPVKAYTIDDIDGDRYRECVVENDEGRRYVLLSNGAGDWEIPEKVAEEKSGIVQQKEDWLNTK